MDLIERWKKMREILKLPLGKLQQGQTGKPTRTQEDAVFVCSWEDRRKPRKYHPGQSWYYIEPEMTGTRVI
jgi:hypothetical protein